MPIFKWFEYIKTSKMVKECDAVFEGGGIRGVGYVGAIAEFERQGYKFRNVAGSSAGAIIASLVAAGYTAEEMREEMAKVDFGQFKEPYFKSNWGLLGGAVGALGAGSRVGYDEGPARVMVADEKRFQGQTALAREALCRVMAAVRDGGYAIDRCRMFPC